MSMDVSVLWVLKDGEMAERGSRVGMLYRPRSVRVGLVPPAYLCIPSCSSTQHSNWRSLGKNLPAGSAPTAGWCSALCFTVGNLSELALPPFFYQLVKLLPFITVRVSSSA